MTNCPSADIHMESPSPIQTAMVRVNPQSRITNSQGQIDEKLSRLVRLTKGKQSFREIGKEIDVSPSTLCRAYHGKMINADDLDKIKNWISKKNPFFE